jgi:hypothetical protein
VYCNKNLLTWLLDFNNKNLGPSQHAKSLLYSDHAIQRDIIAKEIPVTKLAMTNIVTWMSRPFGINLMKSAQWFKKYYKAVSPSKRAPTKGRAIAGALDAI